MATAELAAALPVLLLMTGVVLAAVAVLSAHVRGQDAAREAVRALARGDDAAAHQLVLRAASGAAMTSSSTGAEVTATVTVHVRPLGGMFPAVTVTERATAEREPTGNGS